ncbi:hypothetical protein HYH02_000983 [Chlamydomonas schloesseri]|uniref:Uncharacterized protein n=1 Tax=Chlamydomonas schloesseri TaxID=2026947 RepID=A0A836BD71_9CHLO|nr:hypothetical protein HYH02_000983 [Chlamydomonas schloesseri]|eukprot:KAG2455167.1 hypothetical protein HYH02_000983 [Chlamydomonas schloesseri]
MLANSNARVVCKVRASSAAVTRPARPARVGCVVRANKKLDERGVIAKDNSGRQNIFPTSSKAYYSSPTSSAVASSGLGGQQGLGVIAAAFAIVALATAGVVLKQGDETLAQVNNAYQGESLTVISSRIAKSL